MRRAGAVALAMLLAGTACTYRPERPHPKPSPTGSSPSATATATGAPVESEIEAKLALDDSFDVFWCDPDSYPVGVSASERRQRALTWFGVSGSSPDAVAIRAHLGLREPLDDDDKAAVYETFKRVRPIDVRAEAGGFRFALDVEGEGVELLRGRVDRDGRITVASRTSVEGASCPVCLAAGTMIDTPAGPRPVEALRPGDEVWTQDGRGARVAARLLRTVRRPMGIGHALLRVTLADGRAVIAAAAHPDATGRPLAWLRAGDVLDGSTVARIEAVMMETAATYDLLPDGPTGTYWADGILLGSTLRTRRPPAPL